MRCVSGQSGLFAKKMMMGALGLTVVVVMAACSKKDQPVKSDASQIAAQVNDSEISIHQVQAMLQLQPALANQLGAAAPGRLLDSLIEQELAAQAARKAGLDSAPHVLQAMALAKREVLARAYQDQLGEKATAPDAAAVDRYYDAHPELFAQRHQYALQETVIQATAEQAQPIMDSLAGLSSVESVNRLVADSGLPHSSRHSVQWAEALSMDLLPRLASLKNGQSISVYRPDGLVILTLLHSDLAPVTRGIAGRAIQSALLAASKREVVKKGMATLRQGAKIERKGSFAQQPALGSAASAP